MVSEVKAVEPPKVMGVDKWEAEEAARNLTRSFEIRRKPKLLAAALSVLEKQRKDATKAIGWAGKL